MVALIRLDSLPLPLANAAFLTKPASESHPWTEHLTHYPVHHRLFDISEILELILIMCAEDRPTLKECALVNSSWLPLVRPLLFETLTLANNDNLPIVLSGLDTLPWLGPCVRNLKWGPGCYISQATLSSCDVTTLLKLVNVHTLSWVAMGWEKLITKEENRLALLTFFSRIRVLHLDKILQSRAELLGFLGCFTSLQELNLGMVSTWPDLGRTSADVMLRPADMNATTIIRPQLQRLTLKWDVQLVQYVWSQLFSLIDFSCIKEVRTQHGVRLVTDYVEDVCAAGKESLERVDLSVKFHASLLGEFIAKNSEYDPCSRACLPGATMNEYSLSAAGKLRHLRIQALLHHKDDHAATWLGQVLSSVTSTVLEHVEYDLTFNSMATFTSETWKPLIASIENQVSRLGESTVLKVHVHVRTNNSLTCEAASSVFASLVERGAVVLYFFPARPEGSPWLVACL
jgi:hypothetical protein